MTMKVSNSNIQIRPSPIHEIEKKPAGRVKNFHNLNLRGTLGIGLFKWREIGWVKD
jgi:hypothetical protein